MHPSKLKQVCLPGIMLSVVDHGQIWRGLTVLQNYRAGCGIRLFMVFRHDAEAWIPHDWCQIRIRAILNGRHTLKKVKIYNKIKSTNSDLLLPGGAPAPHIVQWPCLSAAFQTPAAPATSNRLPSHQACHNFALKIVTRIALDVLTIAHAYDQSMLDNQHTVVYFLDSIICMSWKVPDHRCHVSNSKNLHTSSMKIITSTD